MRLAANAVEFVFDEEFLRHCARDVREIRCGRGQHELQRMKEAHLDGAQDAGAGAHRRLADVATKHVGHRNISQWLLERAGDSVLDQAFAQTDAQISHQKLYEVFRL